MSVRVYPILIIAALLCLAIVPLAINAQQHNSLKNSQFLGRATSAQDVIRQLEATEE